MSEVDAGPPVAVPTNESSSDDATGEGTEVTHSRDEEHEAAASFSFTGGGTHDEEADRIGRPASAPSSTVSIEAPPSRKYAGRLTLTRGQNIGARMASNHPCARAVLESMPSPGIPDVSAGAGHPVPVLTRVTAGQQEIKVPRDLLPSNATEAMRVISHSGGRGARGATNFSSRDSPRGETPRECKGRGPGVPIEKYGEHVEWGRTGDEPRKFLRCALVGNSGTVLLHKRGEEIDSHDVVMRLNQAPTRGYHHHVGSRTTHRLLSAVWTQAYADLGRFREYRSGSELPLESEVRLIASWAPATAFVHMSRHVHDGRGRWDVKPLMLNRRTFSAAESAIKRFRLCMLGLQESTPHQNQELSRKGDDAVPSRRSYSRSTRLQHMVDRAMFTEKSELRLWREEARAEEGYKALAKKVRSFEQRQHPEGYPWRRGRAAAGVARGRTMLNTKEDVSKDVEEAQESSDFLVQQRTAERLEQRIAFRGGADPSTGMVAIAVLSQMCSQVSVYGLGSGGLNRLTGGAGLPIQYFRRARQMQNIKSTRFGGGKNYQHSFGAEEAVAEVLAKAGRLRLCGEDETCLGDEEEDEC